MKKIVFLLFFFGSIGLQASLIYIPCEGGVASATQTADSNIKMGYEMLSAQVDKINQAYAKNAAALKKSNDLLYVNEELKMKYLLTLKEINLMQKELIKIKSTPDIH